jgi:predicted cupin superfamily sugar epimerase
MDDARAIIERLSLSAHPEGGWYRETWRADAAPDTRASATAILFLLEHGQRSHWHRVDAVELWLWHSGHPLDLAIAAGDGATPQAVRLGPDILAGETPQAIVPAHHWQAAHADRGWALVSCVVSPGFDFAGFTLAAAGWAPGDE